MEKRQPTTLAELNVISEKTGIAIHRLQAEYGIYEFTFSSCSEACENYKDKGGYKSAPFFASKDDHSKLETVAYHKGWEEISLKECPDVTKLDFQQSFDFLKVCFKKGQQLLSLVETLEKNIGEDVVKISEFFKYGKGGIMLTFYDYSECPVRELSNKLIKLIDKHYLNEMNKTWNQEKLISLYQEMLDYGFAEVRPFPEAFGELSKKITKTAKTISELHTLEFAHSKLSRWKELLPKTELKDIFPTLEDFLSMFYQTRMSRSETKSSVQWVLSDLFHRCKTDSDARRLLDVGRKFLKEEGQSDRVYEWMYKPVNERIVREKLANHPRLNQFSSLRSEAGIHSDIGKEIDVLWINATEKALKQPIPSFSKLYNLAHESLKEKVLTRWNSWSLQQLDGVDTWEDLTRYNMEGLIPVPKYRFSGEYHIWAPTRTSLSTFLVFMERIINTAPDLTSKFKVLKVIVERSQHLRECHAWDLLLPEATVLTRNILETEDVTIQNLWVMYEYVRKLSTMKDTEAEELIADTIITKDPAAIEKIYETVKDNERLRSKYLKLKVEQAMS